MLRQPTVSRNQIDWIQSLIRRLKKPKVKVNGSMHLFRRLDLILY